MPRLFVAIETPEAVRAQIGRLQRELEGVRWVPASQLHLTLRFIGEHPALEVPRLVEALKAVRVPTFSASLRGMGQFPPRRPAQVLWAGISPVEETRGLAAAVEAAVLSVGIPPEDREFSPHLTVARVKRASPASVRRFLEAHAALLSDPFRVSEFLLYASELTPDGARHTVLERFPLEEHPSAP